MTYTIGQIAEIIDGDRGKNYPQQADFSAQGFCLFLNTGNVTTEGFSFAENQFISQEKDFQLRKGKLMRGDIVYTTRGTVGNAALYDDSILYEHLRINSGMVILRCHEEVADRRVLYQILKSDYYRPYFKSFCTGSAQPQLPIKNFSQIKIDLPPIETQKRIADILSAYDDLIENNQKQIKLLEEAAQRLYKEWFIDLHFPGYETTPIVNGIPEGWNYVTLNQLIKYEIGGGWGSDMITNECEVPAYVIRGTDLYNLTHGNCNEIPYRYHSKTNLMARVLQDGDIIFEVSGGSKTEGVARTALIRRAILEQFGGQVMCASFCKLIRPANAKMSQYLYDTFVYLRSSGETAKYDKRSASSIVNYRWKDFLEQQMIFVPSEVVLEKYNNLSGNIYRKILSCSRTIQTAKITRDRLLPKLMSGEIEV